MSGHAANGAFGRDVFIALAAVAWADGTLDPDEADAIVRAAADLGVELEKKRRGLRSR
jgi:tellurite resistance protein